MPGYTLEDLQAAEVVNAREIARWENYTGNNPNKWQSQRNAAARKVLEIREELLRNGTIEPVNFREGVQLALDKAYPNSQPRRIVELNGQRWRKRYEMRSDWTQYGQSWELLQPDTGK
ncbi:hypothetical protein EJMOOK_05490 [Rhodanobacter sp. Root179]|uniref:hypothetical protein n=1 Tax=Rhodanobacter sp. Root179 TaxID=1736482 RepID=UPI0006F572B4|nr:hypothetical protein [Rhodanobacter sp. Root179]KRB39269.1 hypothetical protein ASD82_11315 [Rhodanobacter sp. Root179]